jgi:tetratricopeptide (TPR) repeat protein
MRTDRDMRDASPDRRVKGAALPTSTSSVDPAPGDVAREADALMRAERFEDAATLLASAVAKHSARGLLLRLLIAQVQLGRLAEAAALRPKLLTRITAEEAARCVADLWKLSRRCSMQRRTEEAAFAADCAARALRAHDVLGQLSDGALADGLHADALAGSGQQALRALGHLLSRPLDRSFFIKFLSALGGSRPHIGGKRPLDILALGARKLGTAAEVPAGLRDAAALILFAAQDFPGAVEAGRGAAPGSLCAQIAGDAAMRVRVGRDLREDAQKRRPRAAKVQPPFIVVHRGRQDYVGLCAASLARQNGEGNVVLLGDATTASIGIGRYAAISDYFEAAEAFAPTYVHHSVSDPIYGLFSFQRWLVVEEYCRKNRIDQCVVIDSDALAFSPASEIIAAIPAGFAMNDWTWTTTVRNTTALGALADCMRGIYARPREEVVPLVNSLGRYIAGRETRSFQDMHMFYHFRDKNPELVVSQWRLPFHGGLDQASTLDNGVETGTPNQIAPLVLGRPLKRPYLLNGRLHFREDGENDRLLRFHTVHCQGPAKAVMHHYAALMLPDVRETLAGWTATRPPERAAPQQAPTPAGEKESEARRPKLLPNLRKAEHAALRDRLRRTVLGMAPFAATVQLQLPEGNRIVAGSDLPVAVTLRNDGKHDLPVSLEGYDVLLAGFRITTTTPSGPQQVAEPRLALPAAAVPAGGTLTLRGKLPTAKLAPGQYDLAADLVYEYVRWFHGERTRPRTSIEIKPA